MKSEAHCVTKPGKQLDCKRRRDVSRFAAVIRQYRTERRHPALSAAQFSSSHISATFGFQTKELAAQFGHMMNAVTAIKTTEKFVSSERSKTAWRTGVLPARKFDRFRKSDHADLGHLRKLYDWLFVPITLWSIDIEALFRAALDRTSSGSD